MPDVAEAGSSGCAPCAVAKAAERGEAAEVTPSRRFREMGGVQIELAKRIEAGDKGGCPAGFCFNLRLVVSIAKRCWPLVA